MRKRYTPIFQLALLLGFLLLNTSLFGQIDLELSLNQNDDSPSAWSNYTVTAELVNKGSSTAQNIRVAIPMLADTKYQGGNEYTTTTGTFTPYGQQEWIIPNLAANQTATLTIHLFATVNSPGATYAQVLQASPDDIDSTPGNGNGSSVNEDDEALSFGGGNPTGGKADLKLSDINIPASSEAGSVVSYTLDLENTGDETASGDFKIVVYLSNTPGTAGSLTEVGEINTGNIGVGIIQDVSGAISIPGNYPAGNANLVFVVDANNTIDESNENNNVVSRPFSVTDDSGPSDDFCGFEKLYFELNPPPTTDIAQRPVLVNSEETSEGYFMKIIESNSEYRDLLINTKGTLIEFDPNASAPTYQTPPLPSGGSYVVNSLGPNSFQLEVKNANGQVIFNKSYSDVTSSNANPQANLTPRLFEKSDGYYLMGTWVNPNGGVATYYLITLNASGDITDLYEETLTNDNYSFDYIGILPNDDLILTIHNISTRSINLARVNINGSVWNNNIIGDLVSNRVQQVNYVSAENAVYLLVYDDPWTEVRKVSVGSGNTIWNTRLTDVFNPNSTITRIHNPTTKMILTDDGGIVISYRYNNPLGPNGNEIGRLDRDGNAVWWRTYNEDYNLTAAFATNDGGFLFTGRRKFDFVVLKLSDIGNPLPGCNDNTGNGDIDLSLEFEETQLNPDIWTQFSATLQISNSGSETATGVKVLVYHPNNLKFKGGEEYTSSQGNYEPYGTGIWNIGSLAPGATAFLQINYFLTNPNSMNVFAEVITANETDEDSTPNNSIFGNPLEDDETNLTINSNSSSQSRFAFNGTDQNRSFILNNIFPNPAGYDQVNFVINSALGEATTLNIYNSSGQLVHVEEIQTTVGTNKISLSTEHFNSGLHFVQIMGTHSKSATGSFYVERI